MLMNNMKVSKNNHPIILIFFIFNITLLLIIYFLTTKGIFIQIGVPGLQHHYINGIFLFSALISGILLIHYKFHDKGLTFIAIFLSLFISFFVMMYGLLIFDAKYTTFSSPNKQVHFVVIETGHGDIYQMSNTGLFITHLASIRTDDGFQPFNKGAYRLEWKSGNTLMIKYGFYAQSPLKDYHEMTVTYYLH